MYENIEYGDPQWVATEDDILRATCTELAEERDYALAECSELALGPMEAE